MRSGASKSQPNRLDTFVDRRDRGAAQLRGFHLATRTYWGHTYKAGYESVLSDPPSSRCAAGSSATSGRTTATASDPAYQDIGNNIVSGGNRDGWFRTPSRNQVAGSMTYFKGGMAGDHSFKVGGEWFRETFTDERGGGVSGSVPGDVLHILNNGAAAEVYLFATPSISEQGLLTTGLYLQDTLAPEFAADVQPGPALRPLPERSCPSRRAAGRASSIPTQLRFAAINNVKTFNTPVPRLGLVFDVTGKGRTVIKANYAQYAWNPGASGLAADVNNNPADWYRRYRWTDNNGNRVYDAGEEGVIIAQRGGAAGGPRSEHQGHQDRRDLGLARARAHARAWRLPAATSIARSTTSASSSTRTGRCRLTTCRSRFATPVRTACSATPTTAPAFPGST